jgi:enterochelin esterase-like enzyme
MVRFILKLLIISLVFTTTPVKAGGTVSENQLIRSEILDYHLMYRVYLPEGYEAQDNLPVIYVTDGQWYTREGDMHLVIDEEIAEGRIYPVIAVFVDNRDPYNPAHNRRNSQFFCNQDYASFFEEELVPKIDNDYKTSKKRDDRVILGLSFGGLNSACFGLDANQTFFGIAMQSPALHPVKNLQERYEQAEILPLRFFLSTGTVSDNYRTARKWRTLLRNLGYEVEYREVKKGHDWRNWRPLLDDVLQTFFPLSRIDIQNNRAVNKKTRSE